jgi:NAD(P)-dependent dehydrogenase (short-subunit alcohol dehydrogenase family)
MPTSDGKYKLLVFGSTGAIGRATVDRALERGWAVVAAARNPRKAPKGVACIRVDPFADSSTEENLTENAPYAAVCWAQGANLSDNVFNVDLTQHWELYKANCLFVLATLRTLLTRDLLVRPARLCVVSSIWQVLARQDKLSYCMTKAALQGLVTSASADLAAHGHLFNAVLPGALDTPMTKQNLSPEQIDKMKSATKFDSLPTLRDVTAVIMFLCSSENSGITGQFVAADLGMSRVHLL